MPQIFVLPRQVALDDDANPSSGALLYFYQTGTTTPQAVYSDAALTTPITQPVEALASGRFPKIYLNSTATANYRVKLTASDGSLIYQEDDVDRFALSAVEIGESLYPISTVEEGVGLTAGDITESYSYGNVMRYAATGLGVADDSTAFARAALVAATYPMLVPAGTYRVDTPVVLPSGAQVIGYGRPLIKSTVDGKHIFQANSASGISILGCRFQGSTSSTTPTTSVGGFLANTTGLVTITNSSDVVVEDCAFTTFYSGISIIKCTRVRVQRNYITHWLVYGILGSLNSDFSFDHNNIITCDQAGAANAYGISATGDEVGGTIQKASSISFNEIRGIPSWDGIMTHDCDGMRVIGNDIRDVRIGIDIGHVLSANFVRNITIANNYIESTATNTWGATPASHGGIVISGFDATHLVQNLSITGNTIRNFFTTAGMVGSGNPSPLTVSFCSRANVTGNVIVGVGPVTSPPGIFVVGNNDGIVVSGNTLQGSMPSGAIRFASVVADSACVVGNTIKQTTTTDPAVQVSGSTITAWWCDGNAHNSTVPFVQSTSTLTWANSGTVTLTLTGCTTSPTGVAQWVINGNMVMLTIPSAAGVSNTTSCTLTGLPTYLQPFSVSVSQGINAQDNSAFGNNFTANITAGSGTITFQKNGSTTGFTAAGNKGPFGSTIVYALN